MSLTLDELRCRVEGFKPETQIEKGDSYAIKQLKSQLMRSEMKLKEAEEKIGNLLPLAMEMALWKMAAASEVSLATQWDEMRVMVKLTNPDFFEMCDRMVVEQRYDLLDKFVFNDKDDDEQS
jgi:hypothetical protein